MQTYLVGGAVRDKLLGRRVAIAITSWSARRRRRCSRAATSRSASDFPVFLHPQTKRGIRAGAHRAQDRSRLSRLRRSTADPSVTLEQDLARRDLTINAMARGRERRADRSVRRRARSRSDACCVTSRRHSWRIRCACCAWRASRRASRRSGFSVADETLALMREMVRDGEVDHLVPERVWAETRKALGEPQPSAFLRALRACGALRVLFPEVDALYGVPQRARVPSGNRHRRACGTGAGPGRAARSRRRSGRLLRADARSRQGADAGRRAAAPYRPRASRRGAAARAVPRA